MGLGYAIWCGCGPGDDGVGVCVGEEERGEMDGDGLAWCTECGVGEFFCTSIFGEGERSCSSLVIVSLFTGLFVRGFFLVRLRSRGCSD